MKKVIYHYGPTGSGKTFEVMFNFGRFSRGIWWMYEMDKKSLRRGIRGYSTDNYDTLCFDNLYAEHVDGLHLPSSEFKKLTDPETGSWRGYRTTNWKTVRFTSHYWPEEVWPDLDSELIWSRINEVVYHYFHADGSWYYKVFNTTGEVIDVEDLRFMIVQEDPEALFSSAEPKTLRNYAYGRRRLSELGKDFEVAEDGRFYFKHEDSPVKVVEFVFDEWDDNLMLSYYHLGIEMMIEVDSKNGRNVVLHDVDVTVREGGEVTARMK